jgi:hypothetical protein
MSEPVAALSKFTPDASGLDRDALLFGAGRASVRPQRRWMVVAGALAASQLVTLGLLLFQANRPQPSPVPPPGSFVSPAPSVPDELPREPDPSQFWTLRNRVVQDQGDLPPEQPVVHLTPSAPPLNAFGTPPKSLVE